MNLVVDIGREEWTNFMWNEKCFAHFLFIVSLWIYDFAQNTWHFICDANTEASHNDVYDLIHLFVVDCRMALCVPSTAHSVSLLASCVCVCVTFEIVFFFTLTRHDKSLEDKKIAKQLCANKYNNFDSKAINRFVQTLESQMQYFKTNQLKCFVLNVSGTTHKLELVPQFSYTFFLSDLIDGLIELIACYTYWPSTKLIRALNTIWAFEWMHQKVCASSFEVNCQITLYISIERSLPCGLAKPID